MLRLISKTQKPPGACIRLGTIIVFYGIMEKKFIVDSMLGKLGRWMLLLGYDAAYFRGAKDEELMEIAKNENRIIVTRDTHLALERSPGNSFHIKTIHFWEQLKRIVETFPLDFSRTFLSRCSHCNVLLEKCPKEEAVAFLPPKAAEMASCFFRCPKCQRFFWDGTHPIHIRFLLKTRIGLCIDADS